MLVKLPGWHFLPYSYRSATLIITPKSCSVPRSLITPCALKAYLTHDQLQLGCSHSQQEGMPHFKGCHLGLLPFLNEQLQVLNGGLELPQPLESPAVGRALLHMHSTPHVITICFLDGQDASFECVPA